jgi:hypothetical protein
MRRFLFLFLICIFLLAGLTQPVKAQASVQLADVGVTYTFGDHITFRAKVQAQSPIQSIFLFFQVAGDPNTRTVPLVAAQDGATEYVYFVQNGLLRPFSDVFFWYHVSLADNSSYDSPRYFFKYDDDRYPWQTLEDGGIRVHWYTGDIAFGQAALNSARVGLQTVRTLVPASSPNLINVYIYATPQDVQDTLKLGGYTWVGGHASPDLGVVIVSIAPGDTQAQEMARQIPHELAHVLLYQIAGPAYSRLPGWLMEGIASQAEQYPNADYTQVLTAAKQKRALLSMDSLCGPFPMDASGAILAYAESDSFTRYLYAHYGTSSLQALIQAYSGNFACEEGTTQALGEPLSQLDAQWQQEIFGASSTGITVTGLLPYLVVMGIMLIFPAWRIGVSLRKKRAGGDQSR